MGNCFDVKNKKTNLVDLREILSSSQRGENVFRIPEYQRGYAWECYIDKDIKSDDNFVGAFVDLWKDILRLYSLGSASKPYYTGMLSLDQIEDGATLQAEGLVGTNASYVVDGQQRLTSLIIIIKALQNYIEQELKERDKEDKSKKLNQDKKE